MRILVGESPNFIGKVIKLAGWVHKRRDHGKLIFIDLRDRSGIVQTVIIPTAAEAYEKAQKLRSEFVVEMEGLVKERPGGAANEKLKTGRVEIEVEKIEILAEVSETLPVEISENDLNVSSTTLFNHRNLTLRNSKVNSIFKIYASVIQAYSEFMREEGFLEIKTPKILSAATEGGANFFKIKYFNRDAFLAQSPQFYKQAGVGAFERVFEVGPVFRAEPHFTTRHMNEYTSLDAEMGFIESFEDIMNELENCVKHILEKVKDENSDILETYETSLEIPERVPKMQLSEALEILKNEYKKEYEEIDIDPEGERLICEYAKEKLGSDLIFLTHYPIAIRPMYAYPADDKFTASFDLLYRGVEIATGGQRIHNYKQLVDSIKKRGLDPKDFSDYLSNFKYGMPPHGGWGMGSERLTQKILGLKSVKEATLFPRDVRRLTP